MNSKEQKIKDIFYKCYNGDTDWSIAADRFIEWTIAKDFETQSFKEFVSWIDDDNLNRVWDFFFGYDNNFEKFADDWVEPEERESYLRYCFDHQ